MFLDDGTGAAGYSEKKKNNCQKSLNKKIKGKSIRVSRIFVSLEEKQIDLFKKKKKKQRPGSGPSLIGKPHMNRLERLRNGK